MTKLLIYHARFFAIIGLAVIVGGLGSPLKAADTAPSTYNAYTGLDAKPVPPAPALGSANTVVTDPTFGSRILRVTDANTKSGQSFISIDSGFMRAWNANSTAIKLTGPHGDGYWLEFNPATFKVGDASSKPAVHQVPFGATWEWSTVDPDIIYYLNGNQIAKYNKSTGTTTNLGGPSTGDPLGYMAVVVGLDNWVCAAAGPGVQDSRYKIFCLNPVSTGTTKLIDVYHKTVNGVASGDPNWPTSASGQVIGIHDISGGTGASWLEVTFHQQSWGANGGAVLNLATNTWSLITKADNYWGGHVSMGNGVYANASGSKDGRDSRGMVLRNPDNAMNAAQYRFIYQPPNTNNGWCDADHSSWLNSVSNPNAPILISRYGGSSSCYQYAWTGEINAAATDGSNTVWRFAHNHNTSSCYYGESFAQISNDGKWALFSSTWDGTLGSDTAFGCKNRIDTFIVDLTGGSSNSGGTAPPPSSGGTTPPSTGGGTTTPPSDGSGSGSGSGSGTGSGSGSGAGTGTTPGGGTTTPPTTTTTRIQETGANLTGGTWGANRNAVHSGGSAVQSMDKNARATLAFTGTGVSWIGFRDPWAGIANVYLDGALKATVDTYSSTQRAQVTNYSVSGLSSGSHTLVIEVTATRNASSAGLWVWVDAFDVAVTAATNPPPTNATSTPPAATPTSFSFADRAGVSLTTAGSQEPVAVGYGSIEPASGSTTPSGLAIFALRQNNALVSEATVPASPLVQTGRIYAEINSPVNTGLAMANPGDQPATVSFYFTDQNGNYGDGQTVVPAGGQIAAFLDQAPFRGHAMANGSLTFSSSTPIAVVALRLVTNDRGEFLATTLSVTDLSATASKGSTVIPHFAEGGGWTTQVVLVNPTDSVLNGTVQFRSPSGQAATVNVNGQSGNSFAYSIQPRSSQKLRMSGASSTSVSGSVWIVPDGDAAPSSLAVFSFRNTNGVTVTEAGVPAVAAGNAFRLYGEASGNLFALGSIQTGLAVTNLSANAASVRVEVNRLDGSPTGLVGTLDVPANGQAARFLNQIPGLDSLQLPFQGVLRVTSSEAISVTGLRGRYNERGDFLVTTAPPVNESSAPVNSALYFPHIADSGGYTTQFILFSGGSGQSSAGLLTFFTQSGEGWNLAVQ